MEIPDADAEITADGSLVRNGSEWPLPDRLRVRPPPQWHQLDHHRPLGGWTGQWNNHLRQRGDHTPCVDLE